MRKIRRERLAILAVLVGFADCGSPVRQGWPSDLSAALGRSVTVEGRAVNMKLGAVIEGEGGHLWIDGLDSWPEDLCKNGDQGKRVRVTGTLIERHDLPVRYPFKEGEHPVAAIIVPEGTDLYAASRRFLLKDARWTLAQ